MTISPHYSVSMFTRQDSRIVSVCVFVHLLYISNDIAEGINAEAFGCVCFGHRANRQHDTSYSDDIISLHSKPKLRNET